MSKVVCYPRACAPTTVDGDTLYFELFSRPNGNNINVGYSAADLLNEMQRAHITPTTIALDFAIIALSVASADNAVLRRDSPDGWTRKIDLTVYLHEVDKWIAVRKKLEWMLRFLTGDFWSLHLLPLRESLVPKQPHSTRDEDCICLLSGGVDSLVGAIDLCASNSRPLFVSQVVRGDAEKQREFAGLFGQGNLCQ